MRYRRPPPGRLWSWRRFLVLLGGTGVVLAALGGGVVGLSLARATGCEESSPLPAGRPAAHLPSTPVAGHPLAVAAAPAGGPVFVSLSAWSSGDPNGIQVLQRGPDGLHQLAVIPLPSGVSGLAISPDGRVLLAALSDRVAVLDVARAGTGDLGALLGYVPTGPGSGTLALTTAGGRYLVTADAAASRITVLDLKRIETGDYGPAAQIATVGVDLMPSGLAASPDGRYLYVVSQVQRPVLSLGVTDAVYGLATDLGVPRRAGTLSVVDLARVELDPGGAVVARVPAGCAPSRVVASPDGRTVWVTARQSNELLAFRTDRLLAGQPDPAARVRVGAGPTGLRLVRGGRLALVADSGRTGDPNAPQSVSMVDTAAALAGRPAVRGTLAAGGQPNDVDPGDDQATAYVPNSGTSSVSTVDLSTLEPS